MNNKKFYCIILIMIMTITIVQGSAVDFNAENDGRGIVLGTTSQNNILDKLCNIDNKILKRISGVWSCSNDQTGNITGNVYTNGTGLELDNTTNTFSIIPCSSGTKNSLWFNTFTNTWQCNTDADTKWSPLSVYYYNNSIQLFFNETKLNTTINALSNAGGIQNYDNIAMTNRSNNFTGNQRITSKLIIDGLDGSRATSQENYGTTYFGGSIGVGANPSTTKLINGERSSSATSSTQYGHYSRITATPTTSSTSTFENQFISRSTGSGSVNRLIALDTQARNDGTGGVSTLIGTQYQVIQAGASTTTRAYALDSIIGSTNLAGSLTTAAHLRANSPTGSGNITTLTGVLVENQGGSGVTSARGLWIKEQKNAKSDNIAIQVDGGIIRINNAQTPDSDFIVRGDTDSNLFYIDASADKIGIGKNNPSTKLDVNGNITADTYFGNGKGLSNIVHNTNNISFINNTETYTGAKTFTKLTNITYSMPFSSTISGLDVENTNTGGSSIITARDGRNSISLLAIGDGLVNQSVLRGVGSGGLFLSSFDTGAPMTFDLEDGGITSLTLNSSGAFFGQNVSADTFFGDGGQLTGIKHTIDTNVTTECSGDQVLLGNGSCLTISGLGGSSSKENHTLILSSGSVSLTNDNFYFAQGYADLTEVEGSMIQPFSIRVTNIDCVQGLNSGSDQSQFTLRDDGISTVLTCSTIVGGKTCSNTTPSTEIVIGGSQINIDFEELGGTTGGNGVCTITYTNM